MYTAACATGEGGKQMKDATSDVGGGDDEEMEDAGSSAGPDEDEEMEGASANKVCTGTAVH